MLVSNHLKLHSHQLTYTHHEILICIMPTYPQADVLQKLTLLITHLLNANKYKKKLMIHVKSNKRL